MRRKMSSDSEDSYISELSDSDHEERTVEEEEEERNDVVSIFSQVAPYQDEPLAVIGVDQGTAGEDEHEDEEADLDGLTPTVLEARYEREVPVNSWLVQLLQYLTNLLELIDSSSKAKYLAKLSESYSPSDCHCCRTFPLLYFTRKSETFANISFFL